MLSNFVIKKQRLSINFEKDEYLQTLTIKLGEINEIIFLPKEKINKKNKL